MRQHSRHSFMKPPKEVIVLKSEQEEKSETKDLAKFAAQLTGSYFSKLEALLLKMEANGELKEGLAFLDQMACSIEK